MSRIQRKRGRALSVSIMASMLMIGLSTARGDVTYTLHLGTSAEENQVAASVAEAVGIINQYGSFNKHWDVNYNSGIPTAEANYSGYMGYGGTRNTRVVFHEGAHTLGMGTTTAYANLVSTGVWAGEYGNQAEVDTYNTYADGLHGDGHAIWPGGFNYDNEDGFIERIWMLRVMAGIRADMGILSFTREAENELAHPGETAEFRVESPVASSYRWYKGSAPLSDGGDISGATSPTLRIANAEAADEGIYHCAATGAGETLKCRPRQLFVEPVQQLGQWDMDGDVADSVNTNSGTAYGSPTYTTGKIGQAINLDGVNDYVELPASAVLAKDITVVAWVNWDGGGDWQRVFDFGTGEYQTLFLTPKADSRYPGMRLGFKDQINGPGTYLSVNTAPLAIGAWVHLAVVLKGEYATLYVNGQAVGSAFGIGTQTCDFTPTQNYIGKSQYGSNPLFNGRIDDFRIYNHALDGSEIWDLWGQSTNQAPVFTADPIMLPDAFQFESYAGYTLDDFASDADLDALTFAKLAGPAWISVAADGTLSGTPGVADEGGSSLVVRVEDPSGASSVAEVQVNVISAPSLPELPINYVDASSGASGNTTAWNAGTTAWVEFNPPLNIDPIADNQWEEETVYGNGSTHNWFESNREGSENCPQLRTMVTGLDNAVYDVYAYFWVANGQGFVFGASLTNNPDGGLSLYQVGSSGVTAADASAFSSTVMVSSGDRTLYQVRLGTVSGTSVAAYIDDDANGGNSSSCWYDGIGYKAHFAMIPTDLAVSMTNDWLTISWPESHKGWMLQSTSNLTNDWSDVSGSTSNSSWSIPGGAETNEFFRLRYPIQ